jgi:hypothetical protein
MAVGQAFNKSGPTTAIVDWWNGVAWQALEPPSPPAGDAVELMGVSCSAVGRCVVVGAFTHSYASVGSLAAEWADRRWTILSTPRLPLGTLEGVSCSSITACTAVGFYSTRTIINVDLAERWNGRQWFVQPTPDPAGGVSYGLDFISCPASTACTAVGTYETTKRPLHDVSMQWNGEHSRVTSNTTTTQLPDVDLVTGSLYCIAADSCFNLSPLELDHWNGRTWTKLSAPGPSEHVELVGLSCSLPYVCTAVGALLHARNSSALVLFASLPARVAT